ncbi:MAG TPA: bifunctional UDP-sugar hydrolase/5'-nucleotidase [Holophagaceae bacterium]|nr:bifunctional UDP-sugar hydrolase/5'-nucleotidase [Holophagaceae bacterium]
MRVGRFFLGLLLALAPLGAQDLSLRVLSTTDTHGHLMAQDTFSLQPANLGWAKLATLIRQEREGHPDSLLIDCGDTIQGEPVNYVRSVLRRDLPEPTIAIMNALGYSAMTVGNHEYNFGLDVLREAEKQAKFPFLSANTLDTRSGKPAFAPVAKYKVGPLTVAIVGFTTPWVPKWEEPQNYANLAFEDIVATAKTVIPALRQKDKVDVVIVAMHSGLGDLKGRAGDENAALRLAEEVPGIDAILTGHTHQPIQTQHKGVPILQAWCWGQALAELDLTFHRDPKGRWGVVTQTSRLIKPDATTPADPEVLSLTQELRGATDRYLDTFATNLQTDLDSRWARIEDSAVVQLLQTVQRQATGAQLSAAACGSSRIFIPKGATSIRQFYALMPYENLVARIRINGAQLKLYLEHAARAFNPSWEPELFNKEVPGYDQDMVDGVSYRLDLGKEAGSRVVDLKFNGQPVRPDQTFTLALSSYRLRGGGGYLDAMGWHGQPELLTSQSLRNLLFTYVLTHPSLGVTLPNAWHTIPYIDRERLLLPAGSR